MTVPYNPNDGMLIEVEFRCRGNPFGQTASVTLLIDTGSTRTNVTSQITDDLNLPYAGLRPVATVGAPLLLRYWTADVIIPGIPITFTNILVRGFLTPNIKQAGVLGRDVLSLGVLHIDGPGGFGTLHF